MFLIHSSFLKNFMKFVKILSPRLQCIPDIRELSGPEKKSLISGFVYFIYINTGSNLGPEKFLLYQGLLHPGYTN